MDKFVKPGVYVKETDVSEVVYPYPPYLHEFLLTLPEEEQMAIVLKHGDRAQGVKSWSIDTEWWSPSRVDAYQAFAKVQINAE